MAVTDAAINKIKTEILSGRLRPGDRLPREADLAADLGVSRNSLREAVRALSLVRILQVRQGDGTYVSSLDASELLEAMRFAIDFHRDSSVGDFLAVRRILEPVVTGMAARNISDGGLAEIAAIIEGDSLIAPVTDLVDHDLRFHSAIAAAGGNPVLAAILDSLAMPTVRARIWRGLTQPDAYDRTIAEHGAILDALRQRDPELAAARALVHVAGVQQWLRKPSPT